MAGTSCGLWSCRKLQRAFIYMSFRFCLRWAAFSDQVGVVGQLQRTLLFDSNEKFESHTGWPSFTQPVEAEVIAYRFDGPAFLKRVETVCNTCEAHLGHVFPDGPEPSGLRYCMNAVALKKAEKA